MKYKIVMILALAMGLLTGCAASGETENRDSVAENELFNDVEVQEITDERIGGEDDEIIISATDVYNMYYDAQSVDIMPLFEAILNAFSNMNYVAVDDSNQLDMTNYSRLVEFINKYKRKETDELTVLRLNEYGGLAEYIMETFDGNVSVFRKMYQFENGGFTLLDSADYVVEVFEYTPEGYLMIEGHCDSEQMYVLSLSDEEEHIALRVLPMEADLRELTRKYFGNVSYSLNNIFITSWSQEDFANVDFYDVFEMFYEDYYGKPMPYVMSEDLSVGSEYEVPSKEFEDVVMAYFPVGVDDLRLRLRYNSDSDCYNFRPRGFSEYDYAEIPYPEVTSYTEEGGVITLEVNAVFPTDNTSKLFSHEVTIKDEDGKITYLGNKIDIEDDSVLWWHTRRMTEGEWQENYS